MFFVGTVTLSGENDGRGEADQIKRDSLGSMNFLDINREGGVIFPIYN